MAAAHGMSAPMPDCCAAGADAPPSALAHAYPPTELKRKHAEEAEGAFEPPTDGAEEAPLGAVPTAPTEGAFIVGAAMPTLGAPPIEPMVGAVGAEEVAETDGSELI
jgi:hypothetical protein